MRVDVVADTLASAMGDAWRRRAATLDAARPKNGDYTGKATAEDLAAADARLARAAEACRWHARLLDESGLPQHVLDEIAAELRAVA